MTGSGKERARPRAENILLLTHALPADEAVPLLCELATEYFAHADSFTADASLEPRELISAALDTVTKNYFAGAIEKQPRRGKPRGLVR